MQDNKQTILKRLVNRFRSLLFCFRFLPFSQAIRIPIIVCGPVKTRIKGRIVLAYDTKCEKVVIAGGGSIMLQQFITGIMVAEDAKLILHAGVFISEGTVIRVDENAIVEIGRNTYINKNNYIRSSKEIIIGDDVIMGWNNTLNTSDGHNIQIDGNDSDSEGNIIIGNHCWITTYCIIGKNVRLANDIVVAQKSLVITSFSEEKCLIGGMPAKLIKNKVNWAR